MFEVAQGEAMDTKNNENGDDLKVEDEGNDESLVFIR